MLNILVIPYFNNLFSNKWKIFRDQYKFFFSVYIAKRVTTWNNFSREMTNKWRPFLISLNDTTTENIVTRNPLKVQNFRSFRLII